jgi:DNA repair protein RecN (Recombination protein N)
MISTNPGENFKPLSKIASGGELSRIMLAVKSVLAEIDEIPVLIFDEIDTGISGFAATRVAEKFKKIASNHQVICVSHLAQIAAIADDNIFVSKEYIGDGVLTKAKLLDYEEKVKEVSRLLDGGDFSEVTKNHAEDLIKRIQKR